MRPKGFCAFRHFVRPSLPEVPSGLSTHSSMNLQPWQLSRQHRSCCWRSPMAEMKPSSAPRCGSTSSARASTSSSGCSSLCMGPQSTLGHTRQGHQAGQRNFLHSSVGPYSRCTSLMRIWSLPVLAVSASRKIIASRRFDLACQICMWMHESCSTHANQDCCGYCVSYSNIHTEGINLPTGNPVTTNSPLCTPQATGQRERAANAGPSNVA